MKKSSKNFIIPLVIYPFDILISLGESDDEFQKTIRKNIPPSCIKDLEGDSTILNMGITTDARTINIETGYHTIIRFKRYPRNLPRDHAIVSHELFHGITFIMWRMGINLKIQENDECFAYLLDYVTEQFYKKI